MAAASGAQAQAGPPQPVQMIRRVDATSAPRPTASPGPYGQIMSAYRLQPGDDLEIDISALPALEKKYTIRADGRVYHPFLGELDAAGRTLDDLRFYVARKLGKELRDPAFQVGLINFAKAEVAVLGEVKTQGKFAVAHGATVLDVLAQAGGLGEKADPQSVSLLRAGKLVDLDLRPPSSAGRPLEVQNGDVLYVKPGLLISVNGEVFKPGIYAVSHASTDPVGDALKAAGGPKTVAALNRVRLVRPSLPTVVQVNATAAGPTPQAPALQDGDTLVVPLRQAVVLGAINKSGATDLPADSVSMLDVLSAAGLTKEADLEHVVVIRSADVQAARDKREEYDMTGFFNGDREEHAASPLVSIHDGDFVFVPIKPPEGHDFFEPYTFLSILALLRSLFLH